MNRLPGILKVMLVLIADFFVVMLSCNDPASAFVVTVGIAIYVLVGGYVSLWKEGAVRLEQLPSYECSRLKNAKSQLIEDVKQTSKVDISKVKLYFLPDEDLQATAYGGNCISVTKGTLENADPLTLNAVLAHEVSHTINCDAEFSRAVFATVFLVLVGLSIASFAFAVAIFLIFLGCSTSTSIGTRVYKGTTKTVHDLFHMLQKAIVVVYQCIASFVCRASEYRSDRYAAKLGYGLQLAEFLSYADGSESNRRLTITEALYRTHPPTAKRIACLEALTVKSR